MEGLKIEYIGVDELTPYENNARKHGKEDLKAIAASIEEFGFNDPIGIWGKQNVIVEGHGRLVAAKSLGMTDVPVIRLDRLTDEQRRAYALAHNRTAELSSWDEAMKELEIKDLELIDMSQFGFDLDFEEPDFGELTQHRVANIENLDKAQFAGVGDYDIPVLRPVKELPEIREWIGFNYVLSDNNPEGKAVHFFVDDYQFERVWNRPELYVDKLSRYVCVATPDFSPYGDMPMALQIYNHYRKHWVGAYLQENGVTVIPTIRCSSDERSLEWFLDGEPEDGIVIMSSMWTGDEGLDDISRKEYETMRDTLNPRKIFIYGRQTDTMGVRPEDNVEYIHTFTSKRFGRE